MSNYTPILNLPEVAPNQDQKETTINTALAILEAAMNDTLSVSLASGNVTLNTDQFTKYFLHQFFGHAVARIVTIPATPRWFAVENLGSAQITFQATGASSSSMTVDLPAGKIALIVSDGQDVRVVVPDPTGGVGNLEDLSNVSGTATDEQVLRWYSADSEWKPWTIALTLRQLTDVPDSYGGAGGKLLAVKADLSGIEFVDSAANVNSFIDLDDAPSSYSGAANRYVKVNSGATGLIFAQSKFTDSSDAPASYSGAAGKFLRVNMTPNAVVFDVITLDDIQDGPGSPATGDELKYVRVKADGSGLEFANGTGGPDQFYQLGDVPDSYVGQARKVVRINDDEDGVEFHTPAFIDSGDVPATYAGAGGRFVKVAATADGLQFSLPTVADLSDGPGSPSGQGLKVVRVKGDGSGLEYRLFAFTDLSGVPTSYAGQAGKFLKVRNDETGLQFSSSSANVALTDLTDGPGSYTGAANKFLVVNSGATGFIFKSVTIPVNLADLADVEAGTGTPVQGAYLRYVDGVWQAEPATPSGATSLAQLTDVLLASLQNGDILRYDLASAKFKNTPMPFIPTTLGQLSDVEDGTGTPPDGYVLTRKDGVWQAEPPQGSSDVQNFTDLGDVPASYIGEAGMFVRVKSDETGLEFATAVTDNLSLADLEDVEITSASPEDDDVLSFIGGAWAPRSIREAGLYKGAYVPIDPEAASATFEAGFPAGWEQANTAGWTIVNNPNPFQDEALKSRPIGGDEYTSFFLDIYADSGFGISGVSGSYKVSSASTGYFKILADGVEVFSDSGISSDWTSYSTGSLADGFHRIEFRYQKVGAAVAGDDCVYIAYASYAIAPAFYRAWDIVDYFGGRYLALTDYPISDPTDTTQWQAFGASYVGDLQDVDLSNLPEIYPVGTFYNLAFNGGSWIARLAASYRGAWEVNDYIYGDVVDFAGNRYMCLTSFTSEDPDNTDDWQRLSGSGGGATSLGELSDVDLSTGTPNNGDALTYRDGTWTAEGPPAFTALPDTPNTYTSQSGKGVAVKTDETGLEFIDRTADFGTFISGQPGDSELVTRFIVATGFNVLSSGHQGSAETNANASAVFSFKKNGVGFGTATFAGGNNIPTFSITATSFAAGDILSITAPSSADSTLSDISFTLRANRN